MLIKPLTFLALVITWCYWTFQNLNVSHDIRWIELGEREFVKRKRNQREFLEWTFLGLCDPRNHKLCGSGVKDWQLSCWGMSPWWPWSENIHKECPRQPKPKHNLQPESPGRQRLKQTRRPGFPFPGSPLRGEKEYLLGVFCHTHCLGSWLVRCHSWGGEKKGVFNDELCFPLSEDSNWGVI